MTRKASKFYPSGKFKEEEWWYTRQEILIRDDYRCRRCNWQAKRHPEKSKLHVHHITPRKHFSEQYPVEHRLHISNRDNPCNLLLLCNSCHAKTTVRGIKTARKDKD